MAIKNAAANEVFLFGDEQAAARDFIDSPGGMSLHVTSGQGQALPSAVTDVLRQVLNAMAEDRPVTVTALPESLTTTAAAGLLGVSRPTLMKMIRNGRVPSHKVGSHHRLRSSDVLQLRDAIHRERVEAVFAVMDLDDEFDAEDD